MYQKPELKPELIITKPGVDDSVRECTTCRARKPLTPQFFSNDQYAPLGFRTECKECRSTRRREEKQKLEIAEMNRIKFEMMRQVANGEGTPIPPSDEEVASRLLKEWKGGTQQIMCDLVADYRATPIGATRHKYMALAVQILQRAAAAKPTLPLDEMSDEELDAALEQAITKRLEHDRRTDESEDEAAVGGSSEG